MSGPKYSEAELKRMEAERLEAERQKQLEQLRIILEEAKGRLRNEYEGLFFVKDELLRLERQITNDDDEYYVNKIKQLLKEIKAIPYDFSGDKERIEERILEVKSVISCFKEKLEDLLYKNEENQYVKQIKEANKNETQLVSNISVFDNGIFTKYYDILDKCRNAYNVLEEDRKSLDSLSERLAKLLREKDNILEIDKTFKILESALRKAIKEYDKKLKLYDDYVVKAVTLNETVKEISEFTSCNEIWMENERLDSDIREKDKLEYISQVIEEVMVEFGHNIVRSDVMQTKPNVHNDKKFEFGNDGIISVRQSKDGAILMEVAIVGDDSDLSQYEKQKAVSKMIDFCSQYPEMAKRIEEKGVIFKQIRNMPPEECFAKKISRNEITQKNEKARSKNIEKLRKGMHKMRKI